MPAPPPPPPPPQPLQEAGFQTQLEAETVDEFVNSQTTRNKAVKGQADLDELNEEDRRIDRFVCNGDKNRFTNISCFDEQLDNKSPEFYVHANTYRTPYGNYVISQAPMENTIGDHLHLMWLYNVRTVVCLASLEESGGYFSPRVGGKIFQRYSMKTQAVFDEKQGITVYQCELISSSAPLFPRIVYIICCETPVSTIRPPRQQTAIMEYMWAFEETEALVSGSKKANQTTVLVHGKSGTRRCTSFVVSAVMSRQILETGKFSAMETWIELRKRRAHACSRKHDFYSSIYNVFAFSAQCCATSETEADYVKSMEILKGMVEKKHGKGSKDDQNDDD